MSLSIDERIHQHQQALDLLWEIQLETDLGILDVIGEVQGVGSFEILKKSAEKVTILGQECFVISLDDLLRAKKALGREKDLLAVKELELIKSKRRT